MLRFMPFIFQKILLLACFFSFFLPHNSLAADPEPGQATDIPGLSIDDLRRLTDSIQRTGVGTDSIRALMRPQFVNVSDASLSMDDDEVVFIVAYPDGRIRVYPQRILVWHEVVNDILPDVGGSLQSPVLQGIPDAAGRMYTITYSPLTGTVTAFRSQAGIYPTSFGVSGDLLNANTILYDRVSISLWSQLLAACIDGPMRGKRLERIQVLWAKWRGVKTKLNGKAEVLSRSTGFRRSYGKDPYGSYSVPGSYYDNAMLSHPISFLDKRLPAKKRILDWS